MNLKCPHPSRFSKIIHHTFHIDPSSSHTTSSAAKTALKGVHAPSSWFNLITLLMAKLSTLHPWFAVFAPPWQMQFVQRMKSPMNHESTKMTWKLRIFHMHSQQKRFLQSTVDVVQSAKVWNVSTAVCCSKAICLNSLVIILSRDLMLQQILFCVLMWRKVCHTFQTQHFCPLARVLLLLKPSVHNGGGSDGGGGDDDDKNCIGDDEILSLLSFVFGLHLVHSCNDIVWSWGDCSARTLKCDKIGGEVSLQIIHGCNPWIVWWKWRNVGCTRHVCLWQTECMLVLAQRLQKHFCSGWGVQPVWSTVCAWHILKHIELRC